MRYRSVITVLSLDKDAPDMLGVIAASLALGVSDIPFGGPVSAARIGKHKNTADFAVNPDYDFRDAKETEVDMIACGKDGNINMIEIGSKEIPEDTAVAALRSASAEIEKLQDWQKKIIGEIGKKKKEPVLPETPKEVEKLWKENFAGKKITGAVMSGKAGHDSINALKKEWLQTAAEKINDEVKLAADDYFEEQVNEILHREAIENDRRADGRDFESVRPLFAEAGGISPILHGSGIFYRGGTHILSVLTLGGPKDSQMIEGMEVAESKRFMHHYNFPPYSSGETGKMGGTNRRMIGHGALAEKALAAVIPSQEKFPYTIRVVSESMASNGSTSMGSVCASTIALMDGGVPISAPVAGIASGLMMESAKKYKVLTDIQGPEDHHGDMDFKVAGTKNGITAVQMDVKVDGVPIEILAEAFEKARKARLVILETILKAIAEPKKDISPNAPKILIMKIKPEQIGGLIGPGGKSIKEIKAKSGAEIDVEDDGTVYITGKGDSAPAAKKIVEEIVHEYRIGERFTGEVMEIVDFGAFVKIGMKTEGLVHVSEIAMFRVGLVSSVLKVGMKVPVKIIDIDDKGRIKLSIKQADPGFIRQPAPRVFPAAGAPAKPARAGGAANSRQPRCTGKTFRPGKINPENKQKRPPRPEPRRPLYREHFPD